MNLSDETLSAFLDAELPEAEMERVRLALIDNDMIAERLADLAMIDPMVTNYYQAIDQQPIPEATMTLLEESTSAATNVIVFPWWRKAQQQVQQYAAAVAVIALLVGYGVSQLDTQTQIEPDIAGLNTAITEQLTHLPSGVAAQLDDDSTLSIQLSFYNQQGEFCRQYNKQKQQLFSENVACQQQGQWQQMAKVEYTLDPVSQAEYQTASGGSAIDTVLDTLMVGAPLTPTQEHQVLSTLANKNTQ
ncbi:hypothetical protein [Shewanella sp. OMA3-2]|uniref:hypothetical protein n=1 Tax=Shewanella sp. OMA3-2 TaxID=2908650 RepID=UPI001F407AAE|nr:hypothetical protein [Shewanella sp. OMA3-2]UJF22623.1 hypothetical protein L0B17_04285 [Shewanella sp. OMA3-2]